MKRKHLVSTLGSVLVSVLLVVFVLPMKADRSVAGPSVVPPAIPMSFPVDAARIRSAAQKPQGDDGCSGASFAQPAGSPVGVGAGPEPVVAADFNLDGKPDFAVANIDSNNVRILLGNGSGGFAQAAGSPVATAGSSPASMATGDFNLDGKPDLAVGIFFDAIVIILLGNGTGGFTQAPGSPVGVGFLPRSVAVGDFNLDGRPDLAVANQGAGNVTILLGSGVGGFNQAAGSPFAVGSLPFSVAVGDFNLDGRADLAVANSNSDNATILLGNGAGGFAEAAGSPVGVGSFPDSVATGDFNLDGKPDLVAANFTSNDVTILLGNGSGGFSEPAGSPVSVGIHPQSIRIGDFNRDGKPDLAMANPGSNNVTILVGDGSGGFSEPTGSPVSAESGPSSVAIEDVNLDGKPDLAVANRLSNNVTILLNTCDAFPCSGVGFMQPADPPFPTDNNPVSVAVGDFNGDGTLDLAVANLGVDSISILLGAGTGSFGAKTDFGTGSFPFSVALGDFNGDGKLDLAVANIGSNTVSILLGTGTGSFGAKTDFGTGISPISVALGDFNGDGKLDLAVANNISDTVSILLGTGTGSFGAKTDFGTGSTPVSVAVGEFNGDGKLDLAVANVNDVSVSILLGTGTGSFGAKTDFGTSPGSSSVAVGDLNGDGKLDLALARDFSDAVSILLGTGTGGFGAETDFGTGSVPRSVAVGDFNGDGKLDLAAANQGSETLSILLGTGTGSFGAKTDFGIGGVAASVAVGDFNADGKLDLAVANQTGSTVSILLNTCTATAPCTDIVCPADITSVTAKVADICSVVNFPPPASDNCPGATIVCNPPSGGCFPIGATTVTCTATNASGNTATCAFTVTVFNGRLQDDSGGCNNSVLFNTITGDYRWCCRGTIFTGRAKVTRLGNTFMLQHNPADRRVLIKLAAGISQPSGTASLQSPPGAIRCVITDRDTRNDTCVCGES